MNQEGKRLIQNKYEIVSKIKQGGFGIVYYGYDHVFEKPVAIKAVEPSLLQEAKYVDLFLEEAKNAGKLSHNNIVHIYNLVRDETGQFYIIMEYVNGVDLGRILRRCQKKNMLIPQELSIFIVKEICKALEYAHNKRDVITDKPLRLVHLDISPSNIMTSLSGQVKLIDFGLAKIRFQNNNAKQVVLSGKLPYMAPEQVNSGAIDRRTDIFSLGSVFYEMLTGSHLFSLSDPQQTVELIKKGRIDTSSLDNKNISQPVQQIVLKMLQKNPENRYQGANGVYLDLVECLMTSAHSVELSQELGDFLRGLFDFHVAGDAQSPTALVPEQINDEDEAKPHLEQLQNLPIKTVYESSGSEHLKVVEANKEMPDITEELIEATLENEVDDERLKLELVEPRKLLDPNIVGLLEQPITNEKETSSVTSPELNEVSLAELTTEVVSDAPVKPEITLTAENNETDDKLLEDLPTSVFQEKKTTPPDLDREVSNEIKKIFDSDIKLKETAISLPQEPPQQAEVRTEKKLTTSPEVPAFLGEEEGEDDLKTVIDVIRLSTKRHQKLLIAGVFSILGVAALFLILDIVLQMTSLGEGIYNRLFPPAIRITSLPIGATIHLDNQPIQGKTPISIPKIAPGVHELKLIYTGFNPLIKSIHVPSRGEIKVVGERVRKGYDPYLFRFKSQIDINSEPPGAAIYINQVLYPHKTPSTLDWEVGIPLSIEMELDRFQKLSGFSLNTLDGIEEIEDRRLWSFNTVTGEQKRYIVEGIFKKIITVSCIPSGVTFYIDGSSTPSGRTDVSNSMALTMGPHDILFKKDNFNAKRIRLNVDKNTPESISIILTRQVRFFAKDKTDPGNNEIGATIIRIIQNNKSYRVNDKTPCEITLPPVALQVVVSKVGFKDALVNISPQDKDVLIKMEPSFIDVEIVVNDALTGLPLKDAQVSYRSLVSEQTSEAYFGATNDDGKCINKLMPGEYSIRIQKFGYFEKYAILDTKKGENKLEFKLIIQ